MKKLALLPALFSVAFIGSVMADTMNKKSITSTTSSIYSQSGSTLLKMIGPIH